MGFSIINNKYMKKSNKKFLKKLIRQHFDKQVFSWQDDEAINCIKAAQEIDAKFAKELENDL